MLWDEFNDEQVTLFLHLPNDSFVKTLGNHAFMDIVATEDKTEKANDLFLLSFKEATGLSKYKEKMAITHGEVIRDLCTGHLLGLPAFSRFDIPKLWA